MFKIWSDDLVIEYYNTYCSNKSIVMAIHEIASLSGRKNRDVTALLKEII
tara:strand:+ start:250 stop:399 length:150 start_codon:yes stop_codon:yes gene_type:complete